MLSAMRRASTRVSKASLKLCVVPDVGAWSTPRVMAALAGVVHNRKGTGGYQHNRRENDPNRGFHSNLPTTRTPNPVTVRINYSSNEPTVDRAARPKTGA